MLNLKKIRHPNDNAVKIMLLYFLEEGITRKLLAPGATHGADLLALLGNSLMLQVARRPSSQHEKQVSIYFRKYITNFVKYGLSTSNSY